jgi:predicted ATPase
VWRLRSLQPGRDAHPERAEGPLVGRLDALRRLDATLDTVERTGSAALVTVIGSPGVGKSRLLREFTALASTRARVISARCEPSGAGCSSIAEMAGRPGVLVVDDLHWAEKHVLDRLSKLGRAATETPLLVIIAGRPRLRDLHGPLLIAGHGPVDYIELAPLSPDDTRRLVGGLLGSDSLPASFVDRIVNVSEGNPLFVTELVRTLVDDEVLVSSPEGWRCPTGIPDFPVPPTIHQLIGARLERLGPAERIVLERASVIGRVFTVAALRELLGPDHTTGLGERLRTLTRRELIELEAGPHSARVYRFPSEAIRDSAYGLLLKQTRADLHLRYSRWLSRQAGDHDHVEEARRHTSLALDYRRQLGAA